MDDGRSIELLERCLDRKCAVTTCDAERRPDGFCCAAHHQTQSEYEQEAKRAVEGILVRAGEYL